VHITPVAHIIEIRTYVLLVEMFLRYTRKLKNITFYKNDQQDATV